MLVVLDIFFTAFHSAYILFILTGWAHPSTRKFHITAILLLLTAWLLLGLYKGTIGYCPLTDWHWDVKRALGERLYTSSFVEYIVERFTGLNFSRLAIDAFSVAGLVFGIVMASIYQYADRKVLNQKEQLPV